MWVDGQTGRHDTTKSFHNFVNASKKVSSSNNRPWRPTAQVEVSSTLSITSALHHRGRWSMSHPSCFTPGNDPVPTVQEAGLVLGPIWVWKILAPLRFGPQTFQSLASVYTKYTIPAHHTLNDNYVRRQQNAQYYIYNFTIKTLKCQCQNVLTLFRSSPSSTHQLIIYMYKT
jgi:hypothetical protein